MSWTPPTTFRERIKRAVFSPRQELKRIVARELRRGEPEIHLLPELVDPARVAIDVGANRGVWTHQLAALCPTVYAFEPNPKMFAILDAARPANVIASRAALSNRSGVASLNVPRSARGFSNQHASLENNWSGAMEFGVVEVTTTRLDDLDIPPCGFIKIDVEGHEPAVIAGAAGLIARDRPSMLIELEERHSESSIEDSIKAVTDLGYDAFVLKNDALQPISAFDPEMDHRAAVETPGYIFNFIFKPRP
ncbi:MAG: FkbM family methyltransferase [Rhodocyclaceae bacterium]|nr:MAG: FkbM family methyltransferase [Rhodocyclaceae bacterium]